MTVVIPEFETERLALVSFAVRHEGPLAAFYAGDEGARFVGGPLSAADAWRRLAAFIGHWQLRGFGPWALELKSSRRWIGWVALWQPPEFPEMELGYALVHEARGQGFATEAARRAHAHAFATMRRATLVSFIRPENVASQRVAARLGARPDGGVMLHDKPVDVWRYPKP
jgi:RimJ/RimL family protein N-acetyltransferase